MRFIFTVTFLCLFLFAGIFQLIPLIKNKDIEITLFENNQQISCKLGKNNVLHCPTHIYKIGKIQRETKNTLTVNANGRILIYKKLPVKNIYSLVQESKVKYTTPKKIAILYIATNKYTIFWNNFYQTAEKNFLPKHQKTYFLFTDNDNMQVGPNVIKIHQDHLPWPYVTLKRFHFFDSIKEKLKEFDYIYFANANLTIIKFF